MEHSLTHSFMLFRAAFLPQGQSGKIATDYMTYKVKNIYCLAPYRKSLQTPALDNLMFHFPTSFRSLLKSHLIREVFLDNT